MQARHIHPALMRTLLAAPLAALALGACLLGAPAARAEGLEKLKAPGVGGEPFVAETLTRIPGEWVGAESSSYTWLSCNGSGNECEEIEGSANKPLVVGETLEGHTVKVRETVHGGEAEQTVSSQPTAVIGPIRVKNLTPPTLTGVAKEGKTLQEHPGTWQGEPTSKVVRWSRCTPDLSKCDEVEGAEGATYKLGPEDVGKRIRAAESASKEGQNPPAAETTPTAVVTPVLSKLAAPAVLAVEGKLRVGQTAKVLAGEWEPEPETIEYQWEACDAKGENCSAIEGATTSSLTVDAALKGHTVRVIEEVLSEGEEGEATSAASPVVIESVAEEEAAAKHKAEEEAAAKHKAEEEAAAKLRAEEAAAKKKAEEAAAARVKAEQEAAAHKKAEEEAAAKKKAEEEAASAIGRGQLERLLSGSLKRLGVRSNGARTLAGKLAGGILLFLKGRGPSAGVALPAAASGLGVQLYYEETATTSGKLTTTKSLIAHTKTVKIHGAAATVLVLTSAGRKLLAEKARPAVRLAVRLTHGAKHAEARATVKPSG